MRILWSSFEAATATPDAARADAGGRAQTCPVASPSTRTRVPRPADPNSSYARPVWILSDVARAISTFEPLHDTFDGGASMICNRSDSSAWILRPRQRMSATALLFCFPHAGGSPATFREWADLLPQDIELCCVQPPGRAARFFEPAFRRLIPLADAAAEAIAPWLDRPYALFGHSLGARVAFEAARALRRRRSPAPSILFVSSSRAPHTIQRLPLHTLSDAQLVRELQKLGGLPQEVINARDLLDLVLPLLRADLEAYETYTCAPEPPLAVPICAMSGVDDPSVPLSLVEPWQIYGSAGFELSVFPGDHFYLESGRRRVVSEVARRVLSKCNP